MSEDAEMSEVRDPLYLEYGIIGCMLNGGNDYEGIVRRADLVGLKSEHFTNPTLRSVYEALRQSKYRDGNLLKGVALSKAPVALLDKALENAPYTPTDQSKYVRDLMEQGTSRALEAAYTKAMSLYPDDKNVSARAFDLFNGVRKIMKGTKAAKVLEGVSFDNLANPIPEDQDPDSLIRNRFLEKGCGLVLVSVAGSGKSVLAIQLAYAFALGREMLGLRPNRKMKIGIFQSEDSEQDMAAFRDSMREGFKRFWNWTDEDIREAEQNLHLHDVQGAMDDKFITVLGTVQAENMYDLIIVNPLSGFVSFDLSSNQEMTKFLCQQIDPIIKDDEAKCGLILVHHTNKPPAANMRAGFGTDKYAEYVGAGAAKLTNWMRAMLAVMPGKESGQFMLVAGKRGDKLHWPKLVGKETANPTKIIRHSTPEERILFWHEVEPSNAQPEQPQDAAPTVEDNAKVLAEHLKKEGLTLTDARAFARAHFKLKKTGDLAYDEVVNHPERYGLVVKATGFDKRKVLGSSESVETCIAKLKGEARQKLV